MASEKSQRQRELDNERKRLLSQLRTELESLCESHSQRNILKMYDTVERMLQTLVSLRDPKPNEEKREAIITHLTDAALSVSVDPVLSYDANSGRVYIHAELSVDKLVESVVWLSASEEIEMTQIA